jgi:hypothetical protein
MHLSSSHANFAKLKHFFTEQLKDLHIVLTHHLSVTKQAYSSKSYVSNGEDVVQQLTRLIASAYQPQVSCKCYARSNMPPCYLHISCSWLVCLSVTHTSGETSQMLNCALHSSGITAALCGESKQLQ